jgi:hypothetical protein
VARKVGIPRVVIPYVAAGFSALGALLTPPARTAMVAVDETLRTLTPERLQGLLAAAFGGHMHGRLRLALILQHGENPHQDMLPVQDPAESVTARIRGYHAFTERAYGIRPAPESVRVSRLLATLEEGESSVALDQSLQATFAREQEHYAAAPGQVKTSGVTSVPQLPATSLKIDSSSKGPALIVLPGASAFVPEGMVYHMDRWGNLVLETVV